MVAAALLPVMKTDVTIEWGGSRCLVLDCKYYTRSFCLSYEKPRLHSAHLYQISAYLHHHPLRAKGAAMHGVLLYPAVDVHFLHHYDFQGHRLTVASLDLARPWEQIHHRLMEVIETATSQAPLAQQT